jgi:hypothetical protein
MKDRGDEPIDDLFRRYGIERNVRSTGRLDLQLRCLIRLFREIRAEAFSRTGIPWRRRLRAWSLGFRSIYAATYGLEEADPGLFVPDFAYAYHSYRMNGFWNPIVGNKLVVSQVLAANGLPHPRVLGIVTRGHLLEPGVSSRETDAVLLERWTEAARVAVFRPHWSGGGEGVFFVGRQGREWLVNGHAATDLEMRSLISGLDRYIVTAFVEQAEYARRIYDRTTNTIRVMTLIDDDGPFVASVAHRFGTSRSFPIDNFHQGRGGICATVHAETGTLGPALSVDKRLARTWHSAHPETGGRIDGIVVPGLARALAGVLAAASCFPEATCVGWDLLITDDGFSILEANAPPGIVVSQVNSPLLATPRVARFFGRHGFRVPSQPLTS